MKTNDSTGKAKRNIIIILISLIVIIVLLVGGFVLSRILSKEKPSQTDKPTDSQQIGEIYYHQTETEHIAAKESGIMYADNEILVVAKDDTDKSEIEKLAKGYNAEIVGFIEQTDDYQWLFDDAYTYDELDELVSKLKNESCIESANINFVTEISLTGYDEYVTHGNAWSSETWNSDNPNGLNWGLEAIDALGAWEYADKMTPVKVGLIDGGFDAPDSVEQTLSVSSNAGHEDLGFAATFYNDVANMDVSHGTHVAGTMAAISDNDIGICGVYPFGDGNLYGASRILAGTYNTCMSEKCTFAELILRDVKVINCSYGYTNNWIEIEIFDNTEYKELVDLCADMLGDYFQKFIDLGYDFVIVQASGNESNSIYTKLKTDANGAIEYTWSGHVTCAEDGMLAKLEKYNGKLYYCDNKGVSHIADNSGIAIWFGFVESRYCSFVSAISPEKYPEVYNRIIVVGSIGNNGKMSDTDDIGTYNISNFSGYGERLDILAPGECIYSTTPGNNYQNYLNNGNPWSGTSMAAPHVSGVAAMVWSADNNLTGAEVKEIICEYSTELKYVYPDSSYSMINKNLVNARRAVKAALGYTDKENEEVLVVVLDEEEPEEIPVPEDGAILNYVVDISTGDPISDAKITAKLVNKNGELQDIPEEYTVTTDISGHFEIILPAGEYVLIVEKDGYDTFTSEKYTVLDGEVCYGDDYIKLTVAQTDDDTNSADDETNLLYTFTEEHTEGTFVYEDEYSYNEEAYQEYHLTVPNIDFYSDEYNDVEAKINSVLDEYKTDVSGFTPIDSIDGLMCYWSSEIDYEVVAANNDYCSLVINIYEYAGGAHGFYGSNCYTFDISSGDSLEFSWLCNSEADTLAFIGNYIFNTYGSDSKYSALEGWNTTDLQYFDDWYIDGSEIIFHFGQYNLGPYAAGCQEFAVPLSELSPYFNEYALNLFNLSEDEDAQQNSVYTDGIHTYAVYDLGGITWEEAKAYCESLGGHIATITSQEENDYVYNLMISSGYTSAYFGLSDQYEEDVWLWENGETVDYTNWASGEPSNDNLDPGEDYAMFYYKYSDGKWNDGDFGKNTIGKDTAFICEWEASEDVVGTPTISNSYQYFDEFLTWEEAKAYCESLGGHLVTITSSQEQEYINSILPENAKNCYWTGGYSENGEWKWITNEPCDYLNWAYNEPDNHSNSESYIHIYGTQWSGGVGTKYIGQWNDVSNEGAGYANAYYNLENFGFICEWDAAE